MKKIIATYILLFISTSCFSQIKETNQKHNKLLFKSIFKAQLIYPFHLGNNALADAHRPNLGFSMQYSFLNFNRFQFGIGTDLITYKITNKGVVANLNSSDYFAYYYFLCYDYIISKKIHINPNIGYGFSQLDLGNRNSRFGGQSGDEIRVGFKSDYKIGKATSVSLGLEYISSKYCIQTVPEYVDYFKNSERIQLSLGFRFRN